MALCDTAATNPEFVACFLLFRLSTVTAFAAIVSSCDLHNASRKQGRNMQMHEPSEVLLMLARLDPPQLAKILRHLRVAAKDALVGRKGGQFRLDDLVPIADALSFLSVEVAWSMLRDFDPDAWAQQRGGAR